ncbi:MAG: hypothetical protein F6K37_37680 [Moorea sp. SIO4E2]|nr:hypothetical protein [Moorena sp. SIO4E2]
MGGTTPVAHGGNPQDRTGSPRPRCLPKTALPPQDRAASLSGSLNPYNYVQCQPKTPCIFQVRPVANLIRQGQAHLK